MHFWLERAEEGESSQKGNLSQLGFRTLRMVPPQTCIWPAAWRKAMQTMRIGKKRFFLRHNEEAREEQRPLAPLKNHACTRAELLRE